MHGVEIAAYFALKDEILFSMHNSSDSVMCSYILLHFAVRFFRVPCVLLLFYYPLYSTYEALDVCTYQIQNSLEFGCLHAFQCAQRLLDRRHLKNKRCWNKYAGVYVLFISCFTSFANAYLTEM